MCSLVTVELDERSEAEMRRGCATPESGKAAGRETWEGVRCVLNWAGIE